MGKVEQRRLKKRLEQQEADKKTLEENILARTVKKFNGTAYKDLHFTLLSDTYKELKIALIRRDLKITQLFEEFAHMIILEDPLAMEVLSSIEDRRVARAFEQFSESDSKTLLDTIESVSPLKGE